MSRKPSKSIATKGPGGAPTKLTPELQATIVAYVRGGGYVETAASAAGIDKTTLYDWLKRGAVEPGIYREFSNAVQKAMGESEMTDVARINKAASEGQWQASAWRLERKFPARWGRKDRIEHSGADGGPIKATVVSVIDMQDIAREAVANAEPPSEDF